MRILNSAKCAERSSSFSYAINSIYSSKTFARSPFIHNAQSSFSKKEGGQSSERQYNKGGLKMSQDIEKNYDQNKIIDFASEESEEVNPISFVQEDGTTIATGSVNATARQELGIGTNHGGEFDILRNIVSRVVKTARREAFSYEFVSLAILAKHVAGEMKKMLTKATVNVDLDKLAGLKNNEVTEAGLLELLVDHVTSLVNKLAQYADIFVLGKREDLDNAPRDARFHALLVKLGELK